ncbi:MAG: ABC transporter substrate-binding protein [Solobacterium sp.]|nr:ABC transporter substrate-binding protein [Solobacterium sp.]
MAQFKKLTAAALAAMMLVACGGSDTGAATTTAAPEGSAAAESTPAATTEAAAPAASGETKNQIIYGSSTEISGDLGNAWWTNNATDHTIREMIDDYGVVATNQGGQFVENASVCDGIESVLNEDGSKTFTVKIKEGLKFNNGDPITAANYVAYQLVHYSPAVLEAGAKVATDQVIGAAAYQSGESKVLSGLRLVDDYTYSIQISSDYVPYYFEDTYASWIPVSMKLYSKNDLAVKDDGEGAYLDGELTKEEVDASRYVYENRISAGPYTLVNIDLASLTATLKINENYAGNFEGVKPSVETVIIKKITTETMLDELKTGAIDFISAMNEGPQINTALDMVEEGGFNYVNYERNGYGKLMFQCDFGPTQFKAVRHAVAYLLDRNEFANTFCAGYGSVVDGPYGLAMWMYNDSKEELGEKLETYSYSLDSAIAELEADGWTLNENGEPYESGIRYKEVTAEEAGDYAHNVTLADGRILMPLIIEWSSSENNPVSELLAVMLMNGEATEKAGMKINQSVMTFSDLLNYMYRDKTQGEQYGVKTYGMYNLATNFTAIYDQSYNFVTAKSNPDYYEQGYNTNFTDDELLDELSMKMVYGVEPGDDETYRQIWVDFIDEWNDYLPEVPLYSNVYYDVFNEKIHNLECNSLFDFYQAIVYATVE